MGSAVIAAHQQLLACLNEHNMGFVATAIGLYAHWLKKSLLCRWDVFVSDEDDNVCNAALGADDKLFTRDRSAPTTLNILVDREGPDDGQLPADEKAAANRRWPRLTNRASGSAKNARTNK